MLLYYVVISSPFIPCVLSNTKDDGAATTSVVAVGTMLPVDILKKKPNPEVAQSWKEHHKKPHQSTGSDALTTPAVPQPPQPTQLDDKNESEEFGNLHPHQVEATMAEPAETEIEPDDVHMSQMNDAAGLHLRSGPVATEQVANPAAATASAPAVPGSVPGAGAAAATEAKEAASQQPQPQPKSTGLDSDMIETPPQAEERPLAAISGNSPTNGPNGWEVEVPSPQPHEDSNSTAPAVSGPGCLRKQVVRNMANKFDFFKGAVEEILNTDNSMDLDLDTISCQELKHRLQRFSLSTAYSGIGAPETTLNIIHHYVNEICRDHGCEAWPAKAQPTLLYQVEFDEACRIELMRYDSLRADSAADRKKPKDTCCCFGDMNSLYRPELQEVIGQLKKQPDLALEILSKMVASGEAVKTSSWCYKHERYCHLKHGRLNTVFFFGGGGVVSSHNCRDSFNHTIELTYT